MSLIKNAAISTLIGMGIIVILLTIGAKTYCEYAYDTLYISIITEICFIMGSLISGYICGVKNGKKGIFAGLSTGIPISLILLSVSLIFGESIITITLVISMTIVILVACLGGIMSQNIRGIKRK